MQYIGVPVILLRTESARIGGHLKYVMNYENQVTTKIDQSTFNTFFQIGFQGLK